MYDYTTFQVHALNNTQLYHAKDYAGVFNPGITYFDGKFLLGYRTGRYPSKTMITELNSNLIPSAECKELNFALNPEMYSYEDPRFFVADGRLYLQVVVIYREQQFAVNPLWQRQGLISYDNMQLRILQLPNPAQQPPWDKNWVFFSYGNDIYATYSMFNGRHIVVKIDGGTAHPVYETAFPVYNWSDGDKLRGTSNMVMKDGLLWGVAHTKETVNEKGKVIFDYKCVFYAIDPRPPFPIVKLQKIPMLKISQCMNHQSQQVNLRCIFPSGLMLNGESWLVVAGINESYISFMNIPCDLVELYT